LIEVTPVLTANQATQLLRFAPKKRAESTRLVRACKQFLLLLLFSLLAGCGGGGGQPTPAAAPQQVQLSVTVGGSGTVVSTPSGISCPSTCVASFAQGTSVALTATAGSGFTFVGFGGACSGASCQLALASSQSVSASFSSTAAQLSVTISGNGIVTSTPAGINCPTTCTASFPGGTTVSLAASPGSGHSFSGFGGGCSGMSCQLALSSGQSASVTATFANTSQADITAIHHIIVLLQENRSFDHYFGHLPAYWQAHGFPQATNGTTFDGEPPNASNIDSNGDTVTAYNLQSACTENPSPSWNESHVDRNRSNPTDSTQAPLDGFVQTGGGDASATGLYDVLGHRSIGYLVGDNQLDYYYFMASSFATSDRWFAPALTRTQPNRMYSYAATSSGHAYPLDVSNSPPLSDETIFQLLEQNAISWKIYIHPDTTGCATPACLAPYSYLSQFSYYQYVLNSIPNRFAPIAQLLSDMQNGTLPQVSFIEPAGDAGLDEHPSDTDVNNPANLQAGAAYVESIVNTLMASQSWKDSVFVLSYDEPGGFYDHVAPQPAVAPDAIQYPTDLASTDLCANNHTSPVCGFFVTGFRVPLIVISPFTKRNYVSHTVMDYTAILKLIETRFKLPSLTARDAAQPDMTQFFDFVNVPWSTPPTPPVQSQNMVCVLAALNAISITPSPAPAGGQATVILSLSHGAIQNTTVSLSSTPTGVVPPSTMIANGASSTALTINVPTGITSLTITGAIGGIPVSRTVPVQ
jgi:phospholipase C